MCIYTNIPISKYFCLKVLDIMPISVYNRIKDKGYGNPKNQNESERKMNYEKGYIYSKRQRGYIF